MDYENLALQLIIYAGDAKSQAMTAISLARGGDILKASEKLKQSNEGMVKAHKFQTEALQEAMKHPEEGVNMLMAHAQDHLMNAVTTQALAKEFIELYKQVDELRSYMKGEREK